MKKTILAFFLLIVCAVCIIFGTHTLMQTLYPKKYSDAVETYAAAYDVPPHLVYAVIRTESSFRPDAGSEAGAAGLMQIMPETLDWLNMRLGEQTEFYALSDPDVAIRYGTYLLHLLLDEFGDTDAALAAYHAGRGRVGQWLRDPACSDDGRTLRTIPYPDTAHYVRKVERAVEVYDKLYA